MWTDAQKKQTEIWPLWIRGDQHQKIDNYTMGLNSWKIAPTNVVIKKVSQGLVVFNLIKIHEYGGISF